MRLLALVVLAACRPQVPGPEGDDDSGGVPEEGAWPELGARAAWTSTDLGVGTGAAAADLDGDGDADLVVAHGNDLARGVVAIYENEGGVLSEAPAWTSATTGYHGHLDVGDVDGDGVLDVVVSRYLGDAGWGSPGGVDLYRGVRGGWLEATPAWRWSGASSFSCALGDPDRDGDLDLAVATGEAYEGAPEAPVVLENVDGAFAEALLWAGPLGYALDVGWADLDGDGWLDLALARVFAPHAVFAGDGAGGLTAAPSWEAPGEGFEGNTLDWGDVDGDGWLDLAVSDGRQQGGAGTVRLYCGPDLAPCWEADGAADWSAVSLEDVDGDGRLDLVAGQWWGDVRAWLSAEAPADAPLPGLPGWRGTRPDLVVEALAWADLDGSHGREVLLEGAGLLAVPGRARVLAVEGGVAAGGWVSGPGALRATVLAPAPRDLLVSDWTSAAGNLGFLREAPRSEVTGR